eukprot:TRINITY_DN4866_c0_g1_i1.p1 TRINITY_DN4866_c0_g1~~TRINITY_DN4866_c0_g1_i1.p1  ORF type:complete len:697 (+),score=202.25 TRINITY_DN4866_c0_g1_i1:63-2153(+)
MLSLRFSSLSRKPDARSCTFHHSRSRTSVITSSRSSSVVPLSKQEIERQRRKAKKPAWQEMNEADRLHEANFMDHANWRPSDFEGSSEEAFGDLTFNKIDEKETPMWLEDHEINFDEDPDWLPPDIVAKEALLKNNFNIYALPQSVLESVHEHSDVHAFLASSRKSQRIARPSNEEQELMNIQQGKWTRGPVGEVEPEGAYGFKQVYHPIDQSEIGPEGEDGPDFLQNYTAAERRQLMINLQDELAKPGGGRVGSAYGPRPIQNVRPDETDPLVIGQYRVPSFEGITFESTRDEFERAWSGLPISADPQVSEVDSPITGADDPRHEEIMRIFKEMEGDEEDAAVELRREEQEQHEAHRDAIIEAHLEDETWANPTIVKADFRAEMLVWWKANPEMSVQDVADKWEVDKKMCFLYLLMAQDEFNASGSARYDREFEMIVEEELEFVEKNPEIRFLPESERMSHRNKYHAVHGEVSDVQYANYVQAAMKSAQGRVKKRPDHAGAPKDVKASFVIKEGKYDLEQLEQIRKQKGNAATPQVIISGMGKSIRQQPIIIGEHGGMWRTASWEERTRLLNGTQRRPRLNKEALLRDFVFNGGPDPCFVEKPHMFSGAAHLVHESDEYEYKDLPKGAINDLLGLPHRIRHQTPGRPYERVKSYKKSIHQRKNKTLSEKMAGKPANMRTRYGSSTIGLPKGLNRR